MTDQRYNIAVNIRLNAEQKAMFDFLGDVMRRSAPDVMRLLIEKEYCEIKGLPWTDPLVPSSRPATGTLLSMMTDAREGSAQG